MNDEVHQPFVNVCTELAWALVVSGISRNPWFLLAWRPLLLLVARLPSFSFCFRCSTPLIFVLFSKALGANCR